MQTVRVPQKLKEILQSSFCDLLKDPGALQWFKLLDNGEDDDGSISEKERHIEINNTSRLHEDLQTKEDNSTGEEREKKK